MYYFWQHVSGKQISPKFDTPEDMSLFSDQYFEDYCIIKNDGMMLKTVGIRACEPDYRLINKYQNRHVIHWIISGEGWCNGIPIEAGNVIYLKNHSKTVNENSLNNLEYRANFAVNKVK